MNSTHRQRASAKLASEYLAEREKRNPQIAASRTFLNSTMREPYTGSNMGTSRDGANDFQLINSVNFGAQIRRNP